MLRRSESRDTRPDPKQSRFASFFYRDISRKLDELIRDEEGQRYGSLMRSRISELFLHPAAFIDAGDTIEAAGHMMHEIDSNALFVRDGERSASSPA